MEETHVTQTQLVNQILRVGHGDLSIYSDVGLKAARYEPELLAHLIAWNEKKGEVRDSKVALPLIALRGERDMELYENAAAHLCLLSPRDLVRATRFHRELPRTNEGGTQWLNLGILKYLRARESNTMWWDRTALQHRKSLKTLYAMNHIKPSTKANRILFKRLFLRNSVFQKVKELKHMPPIEAAGTILNYKIPFLVAVGALGGIKDKVDVILALVEGMTGPELINNAAMLERWGVFENAILKTAYEAGVKKKPAKIGTLKAGKASTVVKSKKVAETLKNVQEKKLDAKSIEGDWLVLGDRSGSMHTALELSRHVAAFLARTVKGKVHLVLFNTEPVYFNVTGKSLDEIKNITRRYNADGGTSMGCGVDLINEKNIVVNGIAACSDGGDNTTPYFHEAYQRYINRMSCEPTVYLWHVPGDRNDMSRYCKAHQIQITEFKLGQDGVTHKLDDVDYYSIPNLAITMRVGTYSLIEEIIDTKLLTFDSVFKGSLL